ncbi:mCG144667, partial [Mus musculus]
RVPGRTQLSTKLPQNHHSSLWMAADLGHLTELNQLRIHGSNKVSAAFLYLIYMQTDTSEWKQILHLKESLAFLRSIKRNTMQSKSQIIKMYKELGS